MTASSTPPTPGTSSPPAPHLRLRAGMRVRVVQQIPRLTGAMISKPIEGVIVRVGQQKTGSWFAHAQDDKLWLDRVELQRDDRELVVLNLDQFTHVDVL